MPTCWYSHVRPTCDRAVTAVVYRISDVHSSEVLSIWIGNCNGAIHLPVTIRPAIMRHFDGIVECRRSASSNRPLALIDALANAPGVGTREGGRRGFRDR